MEIFNLTQHAASPEQIEAGVVDFPADVRREISSLLTFEEVPTKLDMVRRAQALARLAVECSLHRCDCAMIGGAPFFMAHLEKSLILVGIRPLYAFSRREAVDGPDGKKLSVFRHAGFVEGIEQ